ncbi:hypothetical protein N403_05165 [Helicobacter pylori FD430]|nr:hypothetical protein N403_05165 [Helicobacter pylori FD430]
MIDKINEALTTAQRLDPQLEIDGPLQFDASIDKGVAKKKMLNSPKWLGKLAFLFSRI